MCVTFDALSVNKLICSETLDGKNSCLFIDDETSNEKKRVYDDLLEYLGYLHPNVGAGELIFPKDFTEILKFYVRDRVISQFFLDCIMHEAVLVSPHA